MLGGGVVGLSAANTSACSVVQSSTASVAAAARSGGNSPSAAATLSIALGSASVNTTLRAPAASAARPTSPHPHPSSSTLSCAATASALPSAQAANRDAAGHTAPETGTPPPAVARAPSSNTARVVVVATPRSSCRNVQACRCHRAIDAADVAAVVDRGMETHDATAAAASVGDATGGSCGATDGGDAGAETLISALVFIPSIGSL